MSMATVLRSFNGEADTFKAKSHVNSWLSTMRSLCFLDLPCQVWILCFEVVDVLGMGLVFLACCWSR